MDSDAVMNSLGAGLTRRVVGCYDESFVARSTQMFKYANHRVADAIDIREERFGDDRNAHIAIVSAAAVDKVSYRHTGREICWSKR